ncbi:MAG: STAS domain-containing protein [bacterium]
MQAINGVLVVNVQTPRATIDIAKGLKDELLNQIEKGNTNLVVDLSMAEFVDSSFLGALVTGLKRTTVHQGDLKLVGLRPAVRTIFELTRLYRVFDIFDTVEEAVSSF